MTNYESFNLKNDFSRVLKFKISFNHLPFCLVLMGTELIIEKRKSHHIKLGDSFTVLDLNI